MSERVQLGSLDQQQLTGLRDRLQGEVERLAQGAQQLQRLSMTFGHSSQAIETLSQAKEGHPMLLPLTSSLYIPGMLAAVDTVLIDVGTGYFVEMSTAEGMAHCKRKTDKLATQLVAVQQEVRMKNSQLQQVNSVITEKMMRAQAQQQQQQAAMA